MSERLYFIFGLPAFEIELKNRDLMVNHKAVKFNAEKLFIPSGNDWVNILVSLCTAVFQNPGKISARSY